MAKKSQESSDSKTTRRKVLKGAAAGAGLAAGSGLLGGFPTIWAQNIKDVTITHVGMSYSTIIDISRQATEDLDFTVEMAVTDHPGFVNRVTTQPDSVDVADGEIWQRLLTVPRGVFQGIDISRINLWDQVTPIYTEGQFLGKEISRVGISPFEVMWLPSKEATTFADGPTDWASMMPGVFNADTLGIRPDLIDRPIESWAELVNPEFGGKAALQTTPAIGIMDAAMALQATGDISYGDMGNMTRDEIDKTIGLLIDLKRGGHWRALWANFDQSVNLMASGEVVIQSMWSPAVTAVRSQGVPCFYAPLKEGYRGWGNGISPDAAFGRSQARRRVRIPELVLLGLDGGVHRQTRLLPLRERNREALYDAERLGLLVRGQGRDRGDQQPLWRSHGEEGPRARRRLVQRAVQQYRGLEHVHGRGRAHEPEVERVHDRVIRFRCGGGRRPPTRFPMTRRYA